MQIYQDRVLNTEFDAEKAIFINQWTGADMMDEDFKRAMTEVAALAMTHKPKGILVDTRQFSFTISPDLQMWYNENIVPRHLEAGVGSMAFVMSKEFIAQMSIEQTMEEDEASNQKTNFFEDIDGAVKWLVSMN